jgi:hypothetical protein
VPDGPPEEKAENGKLKRQNGMAIIECGWATDGWRKSG